MVESRNEKCLYISRVICVHVLYLVYAILLWLKLIDLGMKTGYPKSGTQIALIIWTILFVGFHTVIAISALSENPHHYLTKTWLNVPMLVFIIFTLSPYGFTLKQMYTAMDIEEKQKMMEQNSTCISDYQVPMKEFILLQMVMPVMLLTFIIYPLPRRAYTYSEYLGIGMEFINAFDTMDMIGDLDFIRHYGLGWEILFYTALGATAILIAFPIKIESEDIVWRSTHVVVSSQSEPDGPGIMNAPTIFETDAVVQTVYSNQNAHCSMKSLAKEDTEYFKAVNENEEEMVDVQICVQTKSVSTEIKKDTLKRYAETKSKAARKIVKVVLTVIFTDIFFALLRFKIMMEEKSAVHGFNMVIKNIILTILHVSYLLHYIHCLIVAKLLKTHR